MTTCRFCSKVLQPGEATTLTFKGRHVVTTCPKHTKMVKSGVKKSALFLRGAAIGGARHIVNKRVPGLWDSAVVALGAFREITSED